MSNDKKYLQKRGHTWHCRVRVPPSLQDRLGKSHILKSLKTRDLAEARRRRWPVVANIKAELQRLAKGKPTPREDQFRQLLEDYRAQALGGDDVDRDVAFDFLMEYASRLLKADISPDGPGLDDNLKAQLDYGAGGRSVLLSLVLDEYLRAHEGHLKHATLADRQRAVRSITEHLGGDPDVSGLTRRQIGDWLHAMAAEGRAANTVKATLSHLSSVLAWAMDRGYLEQNPADRAGRSIKARKTAKRVPWTTEELSAMFGPEGLQDAGKAPLRSVAAILLFSGMRIEELCQVRLTDIDHEAKTINVQGGKTANARRVVPVHSAIWPVVERL
ncbi:MAG: tyrosine-type recombinase/integrase, partial [Gammaproteobacteria bacterium]|nr:tyrosine-type recombinase/integrase [Gammaproteobacteria bacterium]